MATVWMIFQIDIVVRTQVERASGFWGRDGRVVRIDRRARGAFEYCCPNEKANRNNEALNKPASVKRSMVIIEKSRIQNQGH